MDRKIRLRIVAVNLFLFIILFGLVSLNKEFLRPMVNQTQFVRIFTGSFPNFIAACIISLFVVNAVVMIKPKKHGRLVVYMASFLVFAILSIEELKPMWGASKCYDIFDILASGLGSLLAILTFELIALKQKKTKNQS